MATGGQTVHRNMVPETFMYELGYTVTGRWFIFDRQHLIIQYYQSLVSNCGVVKPLTQVRGTDLILSLTSCMVVVEYMVLSGKQWVQNTDNKRSRNEIYCFNCNNVYHLVCSWEIKSLVVMSSGSEETFHVAPLCESSSRKSWMSF